jgi:hypothetical protein
MRIRAKKNKAIKSNNKQRTTKNIKVENATTMGNAGTIKSPISILIKAEHEIKLKQST